MIVFSKSQRTSKQRQKFAGINFNFLEIINMSTTYRGIRAERQISGIACWAASMKWWLRIQRSIKKSQTWFLNNAPGRTPHGGMSDVGMRTFIKSQGLTLDEPNCMGFTLAKLKDHLQYSPLYVAYVKDDQTLHVNVIYEVVSEQKDSLERYTQVRVMDPQVFTGEDEWTGEYVIKTLGDFTWFGPCMIGSLKP